MAHEKNSIPLACTGCCVVALLLLLLLITSTVVSIGRTLVMLSVQEDIADVSAVNYSVNSTISAENKSLYKVKQITLLDSL